MRRCTLQTEQMFMLWKKTAIFYEGELGWKIKREKQRRLNKKIMAKKQILKPESKGGRFG